MAADHRGLHVSRRRFVQGAGVASLGLLAGCGPLPSSVPPAATIYRMGYITGAPPSAANDARLAVFRQRMRELGYVEGENLLIDERYPSGFGRPLPDRVAETATELVRLQPQVILVNGATIARAVLAATTTTIPIVSAGIGTGAPELVASGLAASHARPGGTVTGLSTPLLAGKQLQLLYDALPTLARVAVLFNAGNPDSFREPYEEAGRLLGLRLQFVGADGPEDLEPAIHTATREHADGLFLPSVGWINTNQTRLAELALQHRLPSMWAQSDAVGRGGLMAYSPNPAHLYHRAAYYVDRILQGAHPADLPIEQPTTFDFVINLKTAQALGLTIPPHVLLQATEVLQ